METIDQTIITKMEVHDLTGKLVKSIQSNSKNARIDLTNFQTGIYIVTIFSNNTSTKRTVVKQ
ncbi:MAG: T9SS type A sorting domain-containing protein [Bacteroidetes bacterium]|nr:T9SS type A sorting domain-containing protein [Bacteroidota bacterium]